MSEDIRWLGTAEGSEAQTHPVSGFVDAESNARSRCGSYRGPLCGRVQPWR